MLFLTEGYSSFPPFFLFFPPFSPSCHYKSGPFSPPDIRHPEELSLLRKPRDPSKKKKKKLDDQCEDDTFELEGPLITPGSGELGKKWEWGKKWHSSVGLIEFLKVCGRNRPQIHGTSPGGLQHSVARMHVWSCHAFPGAEQPQASQNKPEPECGHLNAQMVLLRAFLTLLRKDLNGKSFLMSHSWCGLGCATVSSVLLIALASPYMKGVAVDCDAK